MKKIIILFAFLLTANAISQCTIKESFDKFTKNSTYTDSIGLNGGFLNISITLRKIVLANGETHYTLENYRSDSNECISGSRYFHFLLENNEEVKVINPSYTNDFFIIETSDIEKLKNLSISSIRYFNGCKNIDLELNRKSDKRLKTLLNCLILAKKVE